MTVFHHFFTLLLLPVIAFVASGYQAPLRRVPTFRATVTHSRLNLGWQQEHEEDGNVALTRRSSSSIHPVLLTAAIFASFSIMPSHATDSRGMSRDYYLDSETFSVIHPESIKGAALSSSSSMQLSSSTMANPIGELNNGSDNSNEVSFGQWFFVIYIVVSLLAGGKEMISRIQKQMDNDA